MHGTLAALSDSHHKKDNVPYIFVYILKFSENPYTLKDTAGQNWQNYIGSKRERAQACLTNPVFTPFSLKVVWSGIFLIGINVYVESLSSLFCCQY